MGKLDKCSIQTLMINYIQKTESLIDVEPKTILVERLNNDYIRKKQT